MQCRLFECLVRAKVLCVARGLSAQLQRHFLCTNSQIPFYFLVRQDGKKTRHALEKRSVFVFISSGNSGLLQDLQSYSEAPDAARSISRTFFGDPVQ